MTESPFAARLKVVQQQCKHYDIHGFFLPHTDAYQSEYVPASEDRIAWLTGFTGSSAQAVVMQDSAAFFTDGRYVVQAMQEVDEALFSVHNFRDMMPGAWLAEQNQPLVIGYDPHLMTPSQLTGFQQQSGVQVTWKPCEENPVNSVWEGRSEVHHGAMMLHDEAFTGQSYQEKRAWLRGWLAEQGGDALMLHTPDNINWLFNIRGDDIPYNPLLLCRLWLTQDACIVLTQTREIDDEVMKARDGVVWQEESSFSEELEVHAENKKVVTDKASISCFWQDALEKAGAEIVEKTDPITLKKAVKSAAEIKGMRAAHQRDGLALTKFLCWLDQRFTSDEPVDEMMIDAKLLELRAEQEHFRGASFPTIAGAGEHGAIVHYRATEESNRAVERGELLLVDSGAQYLDGTTDVTRTMVYGMPTAEQKRHFTLVLKGHIALATARFPKGTSGNQLDVLARHALWQEGLDYAHGTGHGVGHFLCVHEGPQNISSRPNTIALELGMVLSNEPGYYIEGAYGIRIENLVEVVEYNSPLGRKKQSCAAGAADSVEGTMNTSHASDVARSSSAAPPQGGSSFLGFNTLTLAPFDGKLIDPELLTDHEKRWMNAYHGRVIEAHMPYLEDTERDWLIENARMY